MDRREVSCGEGLAAAVTELIRVGGGNAHSTSAPTVDRPLGD
jgi:hypothetical protein